MQQHIDVGDRVRLSSGYETPPRWLSGQAFVDATVERWLGEDDPPACLARLDRPLTVRETEAGQASRTTGNFVVLKLRFPSEGWKGEAIVEVALCETDPSVAWSPESSGRVVETAAWCRQVG